MKIAAENPPLDSADVIEERLQDAGIVSAQSRRKTVPIASICSARVAERCSARLS